MQIAEDFTGTNAPSYPLMVAERVRALRADRDARAMLAAESRDDTPLDAGTLAEILARPAEPAARVDGLIPWEASTLLVAQRKVGKTTMMLNLARCLLTGEPFLGSHNVRKLSAGSRVGLLNFEVSGAQLARWAHDAGVPADRLFLVNLRGRRNPLAHPDDREQLAHVLRGQCVESLLTDPFGRAYSGASQNDAGEVYGWLVKLDEFARAEVGARDLMLTAHAGWDGERSRGSSALEDWADSIITLTRDPDTGERFIRATGRDVDLDEDRLDYDPETRTLTLAGVGGRKVAAAARRQATLADHCVAIVEQLGPMNGTAVANRLKLDDVPHQKGDHSKALAQAVDEGRLTVTPGSRGAKVYDVPRHAPTYPEGHVLTYPDPTYVCGVGQGVGEPDNTTENAGVGECPSCGQPNSADRHAAGMPCLNCRASEGEPEAVGS